MIYKKVAKIEEEISAIGIGCWNFGGDWDSTEDNNSAKIIGCFMCLIPEKSSFRCNQDLIS